MFDWPLDREGKLAVVAGLVVSPATWIWVFFLMPRKTYEGLSELWFVGGFTIVLLSAMFLFVYCWGVAVASLANKFGWTLDAALKVAGIPAFAGVLGIFLGLASLIYDIAPLRHLVFIAPGLYFFGRYSLKICKKLVSLSLVVSDGSDSAGVSPNPRLL
jgi:hypothetical protein